MEEIIYETRSLLQQETNPRKGQRAGFPAYFILASEANKNSYERPSATPPAVVELGRRKPWPHLQRGIGGSEGALVLRKFRV
jgi:hypothetical protein